MGAGIVLDNFEGILLPIRESLREEKYVRLLSIMGFLEQVASIVAVAVPAFVLELYAAIHCVNMYLTNLCERKQPQSSIEQL